MRIHFIAIGGSAMHNLAIALHKKGFKVTGSDDVIFELSKNANIKALVRSSNFKCDMYQKASANIEGDINDLKLRMDNSTGFTGKNLIAQTAYVIAEAGSKNSIQVANKLVLESSGKSCRSRMINPRRSENSDGASASAISPTIASAAKRVEISHFSSLS